MQINDLKIKEILLFLSIFFLNIRYS